MVKWLCTVCNIYVYDEEMGDSQTGISPTTKVSDFPDSWRCPVCGATKDKLISIPEEEYWQKARAYVDFSERKEEKRNIQSCVFTPSTIITSAPLAQENFDFAIRANFPEVCTSPVPEMHHQ